MSGIMQALIFDDVNLTYYFFLYIRLPEQGSTHHQVRIVLQPFKLGFNSRPKTFQVKPYTIYSSTSSDVASVVALATSAASKLRTKS